MILKGYIEEIKEGGRRAKVKTFQNEVLDNVLLLHAYGESSSMEVDESSLILLLCPLGSKTNVFGIPYNVLLQPELEAQEKAVGNFKAGNKITFKADGSNEVAGNTSVTGTINSTESYKVDGVQVVTNQQATIANPSGGSTVDAQARAAITSILTALKTHGLIAS